jgi:putative transposase
MARPLRIEFAGAIWHVTSRGNERRAIVRDDVDREAWLEVLGQVVEWLGWRLHAYVLMTNHYHLLVETPEPNLSRGMRELNGRYGQRFNRRHERAGHLFQGRFRGILVEKEAHLLELCRYVALNPVRAGVVERPGDWPWSSYRATAGRCPAPEWLEVRWTLRQFGASLETARRRYREFVAEGAGARPWEGLVGQVDLGGEAFRERLAEMAKGARDRREIPSRQRRPWAPSLERLCESVASASGTRVAHIVDGRGGAERMLVAFLGRELCRERLGPIAELLRVDIGRVSQLVAAGRALAAEDRTFRRRVKEIEAGLGSRAN